MESCQLRSLRLTLVGIDCGAGSCALSQAWVLFMFMWTPLCCSPSIGPLSVFLLPFLFFAGFDSTTCGLILHLLMWGLSHVGLLVFFVGFFNRIVMYSIHPGINCLWNYKFFNFYVDFLVGLWVFLVSCIFSCKLFYFRFYFQDSCVLNTSW